VSRRTLEEHGYRVIEASSGAEALMLAESWPAPIDLVVTDVVLPELNGRETAEALELLRPGIRVLFVSGYTADALLHHRVTESGAPFLEKPFTVEALAGAVRGALDAGIA
jgi:CheY-like chemotaxis protein